MRLTGNTILITGGGSGIGRGLAESFHALGNQVIIAGRREQPLQDTAAANPGIQYLSSTLAQVPAAAIPTYCATKAALHSYTQSLRFQLRNTPVQVIEILPPWVQTELQGERGMNPKAMPLAEYIAETMSILKNSPDAAEIVVERAKAMRFAERDGIYDAFFTNLNQGFTAAQAKEVV